MPSAAFSMSASSKTITGALPPSSRCTRLRSCDAASATSMPARTEPVIATIGGRLVRDQRAAGVAVAAHDVEDAGRQVLRADLGEQRRAGGRGVAGLEDDRVAAGQRRGDLPDHHHQRVVPRRDLADHADRLAADPRRVVGHVLAGRAALQDARGAREEAEVVGGVGHLLRHGQVQRLAGVLALDLVDLVHAGLDRVGDLEHRGGAVLRRRVTPALEGGRRGGVRTVDVLGARHRRRGVHLPRGRVDDVVGLARDRVDELTVDDVLEALVGHGSEPRRLTTESVGAGGRFLRNQS